VHADLRTHARRDQSAKILGERSEIKDVEKDPDKSPTVALGGENGRGETGRGSRAKKGAGNLSEKGQVWGGGDSGSLSKKGSTGKNAKMQQIRRTLANS